jgi:outer membrane lipoprotein-sorting protein
MRNFKYSILAAAVFAAGITTVNAQNADDIMQKHIDAMGGSKWDKITTLKMTGTSAIQGMDVNMSQTMVNDKGMRMEFSAMGMTGWMILTTEGGWAFQPGMEKPMALPPEQFKGLKGKLSFKSGQLVDKSSIGKTEYIGRDTVSTVPCYKLKVTDKEGNVQTCFFDAATYYMVRTEAKVKIADEEQEVAVNYSNFQKQPEGIVFPMTVSSPQGDVTFKSIEINKPVDDSIFKPDTDTKKPEAQTTTTSNKESDAAPKKTGADSKTKK